MRRWLLYPLLLLLAIVPTAIGGTTILDVTDPANLTATGTRYDCPDRTTFTTYSANVPRLLQVLSVSGSDAAIVSDGCGAGAHFAPECQIGMAIVGRNSADGTELWRFDGDSYTRIYTAAAAIDGVYAAGNRLVFLVDQGGAPTRPYYADDAGTCAVDDMTASTDGSTWGGAPGDRSFTRASHGTIIAATYTTDYGVTDELWRSADNGATWTRVLDLPGSIIRHFHATGYHQATGRWLQDSGDGDGKALMLISDDDGLTWIGWDGLEINVLPEQDQNCTFETESGPAYVWADGTAISIARSIAAGDLLTSVSGTAVGKLSAEAGVADGDYVALPFTCDIATGIRAQISFDHKNSVTSGQKPTQKLYDVTRSAVVTLADATITNNAATIRHQSRFTSAGPGEYEVRIKSGSGGAAWTMSIDNLRVGTIDTPAGQILWMHDYGHSSRVLAGSDQFRSVFWLDAVTFDYGQVVLPLPRYSATNYAYTIWEHGGLFYAASYSDTTAGNMDAMIWASPDLQSWAICHRFTDSIKGAVKFAGSIGGKMHIQLSKTAPTHMAMSTAQATLVTGVRVGPPKTNLVAAPLSKGQATFGGWSGGSVSLDDNEVLFPDGANGRSMHVVGADVPAAGINGSYTFAGLTIGESYQAHAWIKGDCDHINIQSAASSRNYGLRGDGEWTEVWTLPKVATATSHLGTLTVRPRKSDSSVNVYIGAFEVVQCPGGPWGVGGVETAGEYLTFTATLPTAFTHLFSLLPVNASVDLASGSNTAFYLCSYWADADNHVEIYYDSTDAKFKMVSTDGGVTGDPIATAAHPFHREQQIRVAVRYDDGVMQLAVFGAFNGEDGEIGEYVVETITRGEAPLHGTARRLLSGDADGLNALPAIWTDACIEDAVLSDADLAARMSTAINGRPLDRTDRLDRLDFKTRRSG